MKIAKAEDEIDESLLIPEENKVDGSFFIKENKEKEVAN